VGICAIEVKAQKSEQLMIHRFKVFFIVYKGLVIGNWNLSQNKAIPLFYHRKMMLTFED
jgi:hypothetical protein